MVNNQPTLAALEVGEAVARGQVLGLAVLDPRERVVARIDRRITVDPDQLITEDDFAARQSFEGGYEIFS